MRGIINSNLRELGPATANPGDAHVNVGSERESRTSATAATFGWDEIDGFLSLFSPRGPSKIGPFFRILLPKRTLTTDGIRRPRSGFIHRSFHNPTQYSWAPDCLSQLRPDRGFLITQISPLGPQNRPETYFYRISIRRLSKSILFKRNLKENR